jgi:integrase
MPSGSVVEYAGKRGVVWRIRYRDAAGKQVTETVGSERDGVTRKRADAELRDRLVKVEQKAWRRPAPTTFAEYARQWFDDGPVKRRWKPGTIAAYRTVEARLVDGFGSMPIGAIRPRQVAAWVASHELGPSIVSRDLSILHAILDSAEREELIDSNPAKRIERPRMPKRRWRLLEPREVPAVSKGFTNARARRVFLTLALTGLRRSELERLKWGHVNLLDGTLRVVESKSEEGERLIALPPTLLRELADQYALTPFKADSDYVFAYPERGTHLCDRWYREHFLAALAAAGITETVRTFHDMRHTALTNLAATGASPIAVMATAGHRSMQTTKRYLHLAGVTFQADADALERRLLGELSHELSRNLGEPESTSHDRGDATMRPGTSAS